MVKANKLTKQTTESIFLNYNIPNCYGGDRKVRSLGEKRNDAYCLKKITHHITQLNKTTELQRSDSLSRM